ncbi:MAG: hypothetical protein E6G95_17825, partial [Alphaproteobacteria bacterium]
RRLQAAASRPADPLLARGGRREGHRIPRVHASGFRQAPRLSQPEGHVQPFGRRGELRPASEAAEGPTRQGGAIGRRSDDDGVHRHARAAPASRHARLPGGPGEEGVAQGPDRAARAEARRLPGLRHDGQVKSLGFKVSAWVRSPRQAAEVPIFHGREQLEAFLNQTDIAVCLLPLTPETEGIFCSRTFAMMPKGAMLVNIGRGRHVVEKDLIAALDSGRLSYAALDALWPEPLPQESPLWLHPKVTIMPHVARRPTVGQLVAEVAANIHSLKTGGRLLQEIDVSLGY